MCEIHLEAGAWWIACVHQQQKAAVASLTEHASLMKYAKVHFCLATAVINCKCCFSPKLQLGLYQVNNFRDGHYAEPLRYSYKP